MQVTKDQLKYVAHNLGISFTQIYEKMNEWLILAHLGEEPGIKAQFRNSNQVQDPMIALEIEKVKLQALQIKLACEEKKREREREHQLTMIHYQRPSHTADKLKIAKYLPPLPQLSDIL